MKLNYFDLLSPEPIYIGNTCSVISPTLKDIASIGFNRYQSYTLFLLLDPKSYFDLIGCSEQYEKMSEADIAKLNIFQLLTASEQTADMLESALNFFIQEQVTYSHESNCYYVRATSDDEDTKIISENNYPEICAAICQRNNFGTKQQEDLSKVKSKKALEIIKKLQQGRTKKKSSYKYDDNMELGNIISAVANKSQSLNILNIWGLTVFQLWDCFFRLSKNNIYDIQSMSVATWGDKDNHFDASAWFKRINTES